MPSRPSWAAVVDKERPVAVAGKARLNAMLATKLPERSVQFPCVAAHDLGSAMGEDGAADACLLAPDKLGDDRADSDQGASCPQMTILDVRAGQAPSGLPSIQCVRISL